MACRLTANANPYPRPFQCVMLDVAPSRLETLLKSPAGSRPFSGGVSFTSHGASTWLLLPSTAVATMSASRSGVSIDVSNGGFAPSNNPVDT